MSRSTDPGHFFQSESALNEAQRKEAKAKSTLGNPIKLPAKVLALEPHAGGTQVWAGCSDGVVRLVELRSSANGRPDPPSPIKVTLRGPDGPVTCLTSTPTTLYAGSWDKNIYSWSIPDLKPGVRFAGGHTDFVKAVTVGRIKIPRQDEPVPGFEDLLITGGADGYVVVWNANTGEKLHVLRGHTRGVLDIVVQPSYHPVERPHEVGEVLMIWSAGSERAIRRWVIKLDSAKPLPFTFATDLNAVGEGDTQEELLVHETSVNKVRFDINPDSMKDGYMLLNMLTASSDKTAKAFSISLKGNLPQPVERSSLIHPDFVRDALELPDTLQIATACRDEKIRLWDPESPDEPDEVFDGHFEEVTSLCRGTIYGEQMLVSGSIDATIRVWPATRGGIEQWKQKLAVEAKNGAKSESGAKKGDEDSNGNEVQLTEEEERELAELMDDD